MIAKLREAQRIVEEGAQDISKYIAIGNINACLMLLADMAREPEPEDTAPNGIVKGWVFTDGDQCTEVTDPSSLRKLSEDANGL